MKANLFIKTAWRKMELKCLRLDFKSSTMMVLLLASFAAFSLAATNVAGAQTTAKLKVVNPETGNGNFTFYIGSPPGKRFNITVWIYNVENLYSFQFCLKVDDNLLNITNAWLPAITDTNYIFYGKSTVRLPPAYYDQDGDYAIEAVIVGDSILGTDSASGSGLLGIVELELLNVPNAPTDTSLNINNDDTILLNTLQNDIIAEITDGICSFIQDTTPPIIGTPQQTPPSDVQPGQEVIVAVSVTDLETGVKNVTLFYTNNTNWYDVSMSFNATSGLWEGIIPGFDANTNVKYKIEAYDNAGNKAVNDNAGEYFVYTVIPEFNPSSIVIALTLFAGTIAVILWKKRKNPQ